MAPISATSESHTIAAQAAAVAAMAATIERLALGVARPIRKPATYEMAPSTTIQNTSEPAP